MPDYDSDGSFLICRSKELDEIPSRCHNYDGEDLQEIIEHVESGSWICMTCNFLNSCEPYLN